MLLRLSTQVVRPPPFPTWLCRYKTATDLPAGGKGSLALPVPKQPPLPAGLPPPPPRPPPMPAGKAHASLAVGTDVLVAWTCHSSNASCAELHSPVHCRRAAALPAASRPAARRGATAATARPAAGHGATAAAARATPGHSSGASAAAARPAARRRCQQAATATSRAAPWSAAGGAPSAAPHAAAGHATAGHALPAAAAS